MADPGHTIATDLLKLLNSQEICREQRHHGFRESPHPEIASEWYHPPGDIKFQERVMGYILALIVLIFLVSKFIGRFFPFEAGQRQSPTEDTPETDSDSFFQNLQSAQIQRDDSAEQFFMLGMLDAASQNDEQEDDQGFEDEESMYLDESDDDWFEETGE